MPRRCCGMLPRARSVRLTCWCAAIIFIAAFAAGVQGLYGNVDVEAALEIGLPAVGGVLIGTWLQQRLQASSIALMFAAVLVASAVELVLR